MLAGVQRGNGEIFVELRGERVADDVDAGIGRQCERIGERLGAVFRGQRRGFLGRAGGDADDLHVGEPGEGRGVRAAHEARAQDANFEHQNPPI